MESQTVDFLLQKVNCNMPLEFVRKLPDSIKFNDMSVADKLLAQSIKKYKSFNEREKEVLRGAVIHRILKDESFRRISGMPLEVRSDTEASTITSNTLPDNSNCEEPLSAPQRKKQKISSMFVPQRPGEFSGATFADLGGFNDQYKSIRSQLCANLEWVNQAFLLSSLFEGKGTNFHAVLLESNRGLGRTSLVQAIAAEVCATSGKVIFACASDFLKASKCDLAMREFFETVQKNAPCLAVIDDIHMLFDTGKLSIIPHEMGKRETIGAFLEGLESLRSSSAGLLLATSVLDISLHPDIKKCFRAPSIVIPYPNETTRAEILEKIVEREGLLSINTSEISKMATCGVPSDLYKWVLNVKTIAVNKAGAQYKDSKNDSLIQDLKQEATFEDWKRGYELMKGCMILEGFSEVPKITLEEIGGLKNQIERIKTEWLLPLRNPNFAKYGVKTNKGLLLYGPPGCGKTLLAKALANAANWSFMCINGAEWLRKYVGESESQVAAAFKKARAHAPCLMFFDEFDAICPDRQSESHEVTKRVINSLLTELNGVHDRGEVFVVAATNRPGLIDKALLRPERFDILLEIPLPDYESRNDLLRKFFFSSEGLRTHNLKPSDWTNLLKVTEGFSGADMTALCHKAASFALLDLLEDDNHNNKSSALEIGISHFNRALQLLKASVSKDQLEAMTLSL